MTTAENQTPEQLWWELTDFARARPPFESYEEAVEFANRVNERYTELTGKQTPRWHVQHVA